jgi:hypothetical protein
MKGRWEAKTPTGNRANVDPFIINLKDTSDEECDSGDRPVALE